MVYLLKQSRKYWHFATIFGSIIEVRKLPETSFIQAMARAREKAIGR
jgi:hypothetical protein